MPTSGWTIALVVVSAFCLFFVLVGVPSLVIGIIALTKARTEPAEAKRLTWIGWLVLGILLAVLVVFVVVVVALAVSTSSGDSGPDHRRPRNNPAVAAAEEHVNDGPLIVQSDKTLLLEVDHAARRGVPARRSRPSPSSSARPSTSTPTG